MKREDLVTINEAAEIKGVSRQAIHAAINESRLDVVKVPTVKLMISLAALSAYQPDVRLQATGKLGHKGGRPPKLVTTTSKV